MSQPPYPPQPGPNGPQPGYPQPGFSPQGAPAQPGQPGFGQAPGQPGQFGQPGQPGQFTPPGQPGLGQGAPGQFGQPGQPGQFGQPGQPGTGGFGQPGQPGQPGQFGQPGQPGQFGQPGFGQPGFAAAPPEAPAPKPKSNAKTIVKIVAGVVALGLVGFGIYWGVFRSASGADVGDCIKVNSVSASDADVEQIDCGAQEAVYKVGKKLDSASESCPTDDYVEYSESSRGRRSSSSFTLCLVLNVKEGDCLATEGSGISSRDVKVSCGASNVEAKVVKVQSGTADENLCEPDVEVPVVYPEPATTICLGDPSA